jgi:hypothetical protein
MKETVVGIATKLRAGRSVAPNPVRARGFSLLRNVQTGSGAQPAYLIMGIPVISRRLMVITGARDGAVG